MRISLTRTAGERTVAPRAARPVRALSIFMIGVTAGLAACSYRGDIDNPVVRKVSWFSYLDGTDIRAACTEGAQDRYRLVYNVRYEEQLRSYEVVADGGGGAY